MNEAPPPTRFRIRPLRILAIVLVVVALGYLFRGRIIRLVMPPRPPSSELRGLARPDVPPDRLVQVAGGLDTPWSIAFLPDGSLLVTERRGRLVRLLDGARRAEVDVPGVRETGEGGLMGLALHPRFRENGWIYLAYTTVGASGLENRVTRFRWTGDGISDPTPIVAGIRGASFHDGGQLSFGPDGFLYLTTGDAGDGALAQDRESLNGKILRITEDGSVPAGNPFGTLVYSWGHRNPQGLAWDDRGRLWSTEHGRSGTASGLDELNLIEPGANYGWPLIQGGDRRGDMRQPFLYSPPDYTWAPAGAAYWSGRVFFGGLRGEALYEATVDGGERRLRVHFYGEFGRIRAVMMGPDGAMYFATSNRDGRGRARSGDDLILRVDPEVFRN